MRFLPHPYREISPHRRALIGQKGGALFALLVIIGIAVILLVGVLKSNPQIARDKITADVLAQAKDALIGYAVTYRDNGHPNDVFGYLPLPDMGPANNLEGEAAGIVTGNLADYSLIGKLPWKTLGLSALRDSSGECLWYAISGRYKNNPTTAVLNWDTLGQFDITAEDGTTVTLPNTVAIVFSPGPVLPGQDRSPLAAGVANCGGNYDVRNYLDTYTAANAINSILNYFPGSTNNALAANTSNKAVTTQSIPINYNDHFITISADDIFRRIKLRSDFKSDIDTIMGDLAACLNNLDPAALPVASSGNKGIDNVITACPAVGTKKINILNNWADNLLYAKLPTPTAITINGTPSPNPCAAVLIFGGERTTRTVAPLVAQTRALSTEKTDATMYLEGANATSFPGGTAYSGISAYTATTPSADVVACITGSSGGTHVAFANPTDFAKFATAIAGAGVTVNSATQTMSIQVAGGSSGGCAWFPEAISLSGKTLRTYYTFTFINPDPSGGVDLGYGFTFSFLEGDAGAPTSTTCGSQSTMGVVPASMLPFSLFLETDVYHKASDNDPAGNHTAIMANGSITHTATNGNVTTACNGTAQGCYWPGALDKFEESPSPSTHNQRIELHTGYSDSACTTTATGGAYTQIKAWTDCTSCSDTAADFSSTPTISRCISLDSSMNTVYFGFTAGFGSGGGGQGVNIQNLDLRWQ
ncbi:MAG TPA: hypothetical protein VMV75_11255 [Sulfuricella sp.]|nr:hypothetical protein [Sulfuricella sp.]